MHLDFDRDPALLDPLAAAEETMKSARRLEERIRALEIPILLKMVCFPISGIASVDAGRQASFFHHLSEARYTFGYSGSISTHSAFDLKWKWEPYFSKWDPYTGGLQ